MEVNAANQVGLQKPFLSNRLAPFYSATLVSNSPPFTQLRSCYLETKISLHAGGANLDFWLCEAPQISIPLPKIATRDRNFVTNDGFSNEVAKVKADLESAPRNFTFATSFTRSGDEVRDPTAQGVRVRKLRTRAGKRKPIALLRERLRQPNFGDVIPKLLPHGIEATVKARIASMVPAGVMLESCDILDPVATTLVGLKLPKSIFMTRPTGTSATHMIDAIVIAMDKGREMVFRVAVCFDWACGLPESFEFLELVSTDVPPG